MLQTNNIRLIDEIKRTNLNKLGTAKLLKDQLRQSNSSNNATAEWNDGQSDWITFNTQFLQPSFMRNK